MERVARLQHATCTWDGHIIPAVIVSHELAHISSCLPFLGSDALTQATTSTLLAHFDGAASEGNFSAWHFDPLNQRLELLECDWKMGGLSKLFNDNGIVFSILHLDRERHLSAPGKMMGKHYPTHNRIHLINPYLHPTHPTPILYFLFLFGQLLLRRITKLRHPLSQVVGLAPHKRLLPRFLVG
jgi:hypothetical protein